MRTWVAILNRARQFGADTSGAIAVMVGLGAIVLSMFAGLAIDSSRLYNVSSRVQAALDAAALAGAKRLNVESSTTQEVREVARAFFEAQVPGLNLYGAVLSQFDIDLDRDEGTVVAEVDVSMPTIMGAISQAAAETTFTSKSTATYKAKKIEVSLVLDVTGSMCSPCDKLDSLKEAAKQMIDTLYTKEPSEGAIKVSLVPYAAAVNVGGSYFGNVAVTGGATDHCVMEREGADMHTNAVPELGSLFETTGNTPLRPGYSCPDSRIQPLRDLSNASHRANVKSDIDNLTTGGWTAGHIGLAWGWYMLSPEWSGIWTGDSAPRPYKEDVIKAIILMTDGEFNTSYWNNGINLTGGQRTDPAVEDSSPYQTLALCRAILNRGAQQYGTKIFTVSFQAPPGAEALLQDCAGAENSFTAENRSGLISAFTGIADRLTNLSLTK